MKRKHAGPLIFLLIVIIGLVFVVIEIGFLIFLQRGNSPLALLGQPPTISIMHPLGDRVIDSGDGIMLAAEAVSESGLQRVDFLVDGNVEQQYIVNPVGATTGNVFFPWFGSTTGVHQLSVVAYDTQGRTSAPASVQVGVQAVGDSGEMVEQTAEAGLPIENQQPPQEDVSQDADAVPQEGDQPQQGDAPQEPIQPADQPADQHAPGQAQPGAPAGDQAEEPGGEIALPPQPQDQIPEITRFDAFVDIFGGENGAPVWVTAAIVGSAQDDLGIDRLEVSWRNDARERGDFTMQCAGGPVCEADAVIDLNVGRWVISLQAFDTSGQASQPEIEIVEVVGGNGQAPGAAEHDDFDDWMREHFRNQAEQFEFDAEDLWVGQERVGADDLLDNLFPGGRAEEPPDEVDEPACAENDWVCQMGEGIRLTIDPGPEGNRITLTIEQPFEAPAGMVLLPQLVKSFANHHIVSSIYPPEWAAGRAEMFQAEQQFTWLDEDVVCHEDYRYRVQIKAYDPIEIENFLNGGGPLPQSEIRAYESQTAESQACGAGRVGDLGLAAEVHPEGVRLSWSLPGGEDWPQAGAGVMLVRFNKTNGPNPNEQDTFNIFEERFALEDLQQGRDFQFIDPDLECGNEYFYLVGVFDPDNRPGFAARGWLAHDSIPAPRHFCPEGELPTIELFISADWDEWVNGHYSVLTIEFDIPDGFTVPQGDQVRLKLWESFVDENGERVENDRVFFPLGVGHDHIHKIFDLTVDCSLQRYDYYLTLEADGQILNEGPTFSIDLPPCPPKAPPALQQLHATNNCGGAERCVIVKWEPFQPLDEEPYLPAVAIHIQRNTAFLNRPWEIIEVPMDATQYIDTVPSCGLPYLYRMVAVDERGLRRISSNFSQPPMLRIDTPECDQPWDLIVQPEVE